MAATPLARRGLTGLLAGGALALALTTQAGSGPLLSFANPAAAATRREARIGGQPHGHAPQAPAFPVRPAGLAPAASLRKPGKASKPGLPRRPDMRVMKPRITPAPPTQSKRAAHGKPGIGR